MKKFALDIPIAVLAVSTTPCATKGYVNTSVGQVNEKVGSLPKSLEETQERTRQNEQRIQEVDEKYGKQVSAVDEKASAAGKSAATAQTTADRAILRADEVGRATGNALKEYRCYEKNCSSRVYISWLKKDRFTIRGGNMAFTPSKETYSGKVYPVTIGTAPREVAFWGESVLPFHALRRAVP